MTGVVGNRVQVGHSHLDSHNILDKVRELSESLYDRRVDIALGNIS